MKYNRHDPARDCLGQVIRADMFTRRHNKRFPKKQIIGPAYRRASVVNYKKNRLVGIPWRFLVQHKIPLV